MTVSHQLSLTSYISITWSERLFLCCWFEMLINFAKMSAKSLKSKFKCSIVRIMQFLILKFSVLAWVFCAVLFIISRYNWNRLKCSKHFFFEKESEIIFNEYMWNFWFDDSLVLLMIDLYSICTQKPITSYRKNLHNCNREDHFVIQATYSFPLSVV